MKRLLVLLLLLIWSVPSFGARLWSSGVELNSVTAGVEFSEISSVVPPTIATDIKRSGNYSLQVQSPSVNSIYVTHYFASSDQQADYYARIYIYVTKFPTNDTNPILVFQRNGQAEAGQVSIRLKTDRTLIVYNEEGLAVVGSASTPLDFKRWYQIELRCNTTTLASTIVAGKLDTVTFGSGTISLANGVAQISFGKPFVNNNAGTFYFDDMCINNSVGTLQNSWPGYGRVVSLKPRVAGSVNNWRHKDGSAGSSTNYQEVDETTPDDVTTYVKSRSVLNDTDFYAIDSFTTLVDSLVQINVVQMGVRFADSSASILSDTFKCSIKLKGGTPEDGTAISPTQTTWHTNLDTSGNGVMTYSLTLYDLPGASTDKFTGKILDTTQIGIRTSAISTAITYVSTTWLLVEYGYRKVNYFMKASRDNTGLNIVATDNYGADTTLQIGTDATGDNWRSIVWFDLPGLAPGTFQVDSCFLLAYFEGEDAAANRSIRVAGITTDPQNRDWIEGTGTIALGTVDGSSWDSTGRPDTTWTTAGFAPGRNLDTMAFNSPNGWIKFTIPVTWITAMISGESTFAGFVFINQSEGTLESRKFIASREASSLRACSLLIYDAQDDFAGASPATQIIWQANSGTFYNSGDGLYSMYQTKGIALTNESLFVVWNNYPFATGCDGLVYSTSTDGGSTWVAPTCLWQRDVVDNEYRGDITWKGHGDTLYIAIARGISNVNTPDSIMVLSIRFNGTRLDTIRIPGPNRTGNRADIEYQSGDTFWIAYGKGIQNSANDTVLSITKYSTDNCATWTLSDSNLIVGGMFTGSAGNSMANHELIHTANNRMVLIYTADSTTTFTTDGAPYLRYRSDAWSDKTKWIKDGIIDTANATFGGAGIVGVAKKEVAVVYAKSNSITMKKWYDSDSTVHDASKITLFATNLNATVNNICDVYGIPGSDSMMVWAVDEQTAANSVGTDSVPNPNNSQRVPMGRISADSGKTFGDSLSFLPTNEHLHLARVWISRAGTYKNLTDSVTSGATGVNKYQFFAAATDTMYYGLGVKFQRMQWYLDTRGNDSNRTIAFKYWNGASWENMTVYKSDPDLNHDLFTNVGGNRPYHWVEFDSMPSAWATKEQPTGGDGGVSRYWIQMSTSGLFNATPKGQFVTLGSYNTTGGFIRGFTDEWGIIYMRGAYGGNAINNQVRFARINMTAAPPGGAPKPQHFKMQQIFRKDPAELKKRLEE